MKLASQELQMLIAGGAATDADFEGWDPRDVVAVKRELPYQVRGASRIVATKAAEEEGQPSRVTYAANVQLPDRMGDLIVAKKSKIVGRDAPGWSWDHFLNAGAPFLWAHMSRDAPIGKVLNPRIQRVEVKVDGEMVRAWALVEDVEYIPDARIPYSEAAFLLVQRGDLNGVSVGLIPTLIEFPEDDKVRSKLGLSRYGALILGSDQTELSQTPTPANPWAVRIGGKAKSMPGEFEARIDSGLSALVEDGSITKGLATDFRKAFPLGPDDGARRLRERIRSMVDMAASVRGVEPESIEESIADVLVPDEEEARLAKQAIARALENRPDLVDAVVEEAVDAERDAPEAVTPAAYSLPPELTPEVVEKIRSGDMIVASSTAVEAFLARSAELERKLAESEGDRSRMSDELALSKDQQRAIQQAEEAMSEALELLNPIAELTFSLDRDSSGAMPSTDRPATCGAEGLAKTSAQRGSTDPGGHSSRSEADGDGSIAGALNAGTSPHGQAEETLAPSHAPNRGQSMTD